MDSKGLAGRAGLIMMIGAALWVGALIIQYGFDLQPPNAEGPLFIVYQLMAFTAMASFAIGYLGIYWRGGVSGRFGKISTGMVAVGYGLIVIGGILMLFLGEVESPVFILFPIGALLIAIGVVLTGIGVTRTGNWSGWQRWMPLLYAVYLWAAVEIPFIMGVYPDGPGLWPEVGQGIGLFLVGLATYSAVVEEPAAPAAAS